MHIQTFSVGRSKTPPSDPSKDVDVTISDVCECVDFTLSRLSIDANPNHSQVKLSNQAHVHRVPPK